MDHGNATSLTEIALVLAAAFAGGALVRRWNQPVLVGYILVGLLLGPSVLGVISSADQISFLAELGLLLLLFVVGMELDAHRFAEVHRIAITTTLLQIAGALALMAGAGWVFGWTMSRIVVFAFALATSSTAVGLRLLNDMGEMQKPTGNAAVGILIAQDLALIPMLLIIDALKPGGGFDTWGLVKLGVAVAIMAGLVFGMARHNWTMKDIVPKWLHWPAFSSHDQRVLAALALCFTAAALAGAVGLSASYGAFLAGLLIGSTSESHSYEEKIQPLFDLLIMVFFLSVGLLLDLPFILSHLPAILTLLFSLMLLKSVFTTFVLVRLGLSRRHALLIGAALGQLGEFSFALAALGLSIVAITDGEYKMLVAIIALSLVITPVWMKILQHMHVMRNRIVREEYHDHAE
jgi:CPA2 family monovalent cation:H+ antiporter-2